MTNEAIAFEISIICVGIFSGTIGFFKSLNALIDAYHLPIPYAPGEQIG